MSTTLDFSECRSRLDDLAMDVARMCASLGQATLVPKPDFWAADGDSLVRQLNDLRGLRRRLDAVGTVPAPLEVCADVLDRVIRMIEQAVDEFEGFADAIYAKRPAVAGPQLACGARLFAEAMKTLSEYGPERQRALRA